MCHAALVRFPVLRLLPVERRWFALGSAFGLVFFCLFVVNSPAYSAQKHGCAPETPPPVTGPPVIAPSLAGSVLINEVVAQPASNWNCTEAAGIFSQKRDSWIELYNTQSQPLDLYAAHAEISLDGGTNWSLLPFGSAIAPGNFLVVFPLENQTTPPPPTWTVLLVISGTVIDQVTIPPLQADQSYARVPDGSTSWQFVGHPTIDESNNNAGDQLTPPPTKTPKPVRTPPLPHNPVGNGAEGSSGSETPGSIGTQPTWNGVQLPAGVPISGADTPASSNALLSQPQQSTFVGQQGSQNSWWHTLLIAVCTLLLLGTLYWCWKLFKVERPVIEGGDDIVFKEH